MTPINPQDDLNQPYLAQKDLQRPETQQRLQLDAAIAQDAANDEIKAMEAAGAEIEPVEDKGPLQLASHLAAKTLRFDSAMQRVMFNGTRKAFNNTRRLLQAGVMKSAANLMGMGDLDINDGLAMVDAADDLLREEIPEIIGPIDDWLDSIEPEDGTLEAGATEIVQFLVPFMGALKATNGLFSAAGATGKAAEFMVADMAASFAAMDPHMERFSTMVQSMGIEGPVMDFLANSIDETEFEGRVKNMLENTAIGVGIGSGVKAVTASVKLWRGVTQTSLDDFAQAVNVPQGADEAGEAVAGPIQAAEIQQVATDFSIDMPTPIPEGDPRLTPTIDIVTPERQEFREELANTIIRDANIRPSPNEQPTAIIMGGGGAAGKGTIERALREQGAIPEHFQTIDPDEVKIRWVPEFQELAAAGDSRAAAVVHDEGSAITDRVVDIAIDSRADIVIDKTMSKPEKGAELIDRLKTQGYRVEMVGVVIDPDEAVRRMVSRAENPNSSGFGRYVPIDVLRQAHAGFASAVDTYAGLVDEFRLFDNSGDSVPELIRRNGDITNVKVYNDRVGGGQNGQTTQAPSGPDSGQAGSEGLSARQASQGQAGGEGADSLAGERLAANGGAR